MSVRTPNWVSKTDLTRYFRCPYAFYLVDGGLIPFEDTVTEQQARLIQKGVDFQAVVEARALRGLIEPGELPTVMADEWIRLPVFENANLEIYGEPDAIDTADGAWIPVEVKSHKDVQRSDELELAFYWMLLEPHRTKSVSPRGYLVLRRNGVDVRVEVQLGPRRFEQVRWLLQRVRDARERGVPPRICGCTVCSGVMRDEIDRVTLAKKDLTRIWGIGPAYARCLEESGVRSYEELLGVDSACVVERLREQRYYVSPAEVDRWRHHATSYSTSCPVLFGEPLRLDSGFLALDLEYESGVIIWLVGVCVVGPGRLEHFAFWADTPAQEKRNLKRLAQIVADNPLLPLVTWNGDAADMPQLRKAVRRLGLARELDMVEPRHLDLFLYARNAVRFPVPQLALGQVARYFAIPKLSQIDGGLAALGLYQGYCRSRDQDMRVAVKADLHEYNRDDLEALVGVAERISSLGCGSQKVPTVVLGASQRAKSTRGLESLRARLVHAGWA